MLLKFFRRKNYVMGRTSSQYETRIRGCARVTKVDSIRYNSVSWSKSVKTTVYGLYFERNIKS